MCRPEHHSQQQDGKADADAQDVISHGRADDKVARLPWRLVHYFLIGRKGSQGGCGKGIHNHVYPKHLGDCQRQLMPHNGANQHNEQRGEVDGQLEQDKALDVMVKRTPPHDGGGNAIERIVQQGNVAGFLRDGCACPHGKPHVGQYDPDQRHQREVVPLGDHLRPDQYVEAAFVEGAPCLRPGTSGKALRGLPRTF